MEVQGGMVLILGGECGVGKSALAKEFYLQKTEVPQKFSPIFYVLDADELNQPSVDDVFDSNHHLTLPKFVELHQDTEEKFFLVDSAEKISDLDLPAIFTDLMKALAQNQWKIILTTRTFFCDSLKERLESADISVTVQNVSSLTTEELDSLAEEQGFILPEDAQMRKLLKNFFYLKQYLAFYKPEISENVLQFEKRIWDARICKTEFTKGNIHRQRENLFLDMITWKLREGRSRIPVQDGWRQEILALLENDEIIRYDSEMGSYAILHDIYEDWGGRRWLERIWHQKGQSLSQTLEELENSHSIRRRVREWLCWKLAVKPEGSPNILRTIIKIVTDFSDDNIWSDELLLVLLLSENADELFLQCQELYQNDFSRFEKVLFYLKTSCRGELETSVGSRVTLGSGWDQAISFIGEHRASWTHVQWSAILPILQIWVSHHPEGEITRKAALTALEFYRSVNDCQSSELSYEREKTLLSEAIHILTGGSGEIVSQFKPILENILHAETERMPQKWADFCREILEKHWEHPLILKSMPSLMLEMCDKFWYVPYQGYDPFARQDSDLFSLTKSLYWNSVPAAPLLTPVWRLLHFAPLKTIDFLIQFVNKTVESYVTHSPKNPYRDENIRQITLHFPDGTEKTQYISQSLWCMYRGTGSPVTPYLLQSLHAALEKFLLGQAEKSPQKVEWVLDKILRETNSASMTAVVCSVVLAYPEKFYSTALILFATFELFHYDLERKGLENQAKILFEMGQTMGILLPLELKYFFKERLESCNEKHRNLSLGDLIVKYQLPVTEMEQKTAQQIQEQIRLIIRKYREDQNLNQQDVNKLDIQKYSATHNVFPDGSGTIEFQPILEPEEQQELDAAEQYMQRMNTFILMFKWCDSVIQNHQENLSANPFTNHPEEVLSIIRQIGDNEQNSITFSLPIRASIALLLHYRDSLSQENLEFCQAILDETIHNFTEKTELPSSLEYLAFAFILKIQSQYPNCKKEMSLLLVSLYGLWNYQDITFTINAIHRVSLCSNYSEIALQILRDFIAMGPSYEKIIREERIRIRFTGVDCARILEQFETSYETASIEEITPEKITQLATQQLFTAVSLIPAPVTEESFLKIVSTLLGEVANRYRQENEKDHSHRKNIDFCLKFNMERWIAFFLLLRPTIEEIKPFGEMFQPILSVNRDFVEHFVSRTILAQSILNRYDNFWFIWNQLFPIVVHWVRRGSFSRILLDYMLASESHESEAILLRPSNRMFYERLIREIGNFPEVFQGIAQMLNGIGKNIFFEEGVTWLTDLISQQEPEIPDSMKDSIRSEMEKYLKEYLQRNRETLKQNSETKIQINHLLDYLRNLGSVEAQRLQDSIN